jgi:hypothetical protein
MLIDERPIMFLPKLAKALGSCERAIVLQQIHWLSNQPHSGQDIDGEHWVWGTYEEWCRDYFSMWTPVTLKHHIRKLEKQGVLISAQLRAHDHDQTKYYRINYEHELLAPTGMGQHVIPSMGQYITPSIGQHVTPSMSEDVIPSNEQHVIPSSITESSTKSTAEKERTPGQAMFAAICEALGWDFKTLAKKQKNEVAEVVVALTAANYTVEDISRFMTEIWFHDWRWEKHEQRPTLNQLRQEIGKLRAAIPDATSKPARSTSKVSASLSAVEEYYRRKALLEQEESGDDREEL